MDLKKEGFELIEQIDNYYPNSGFFKSSAYTFKSIYYNEETNQIKATIKKTQRAKVIEHNEISLDEIRKLDESNPLKKALLSLEEKVINKTIKSIYSKELEEKEINIIVSTLLDNSLIGKNLVEDLNILEKIKTQDNKFNVINEKNNLFLNSGFSKENILKPEDYFFISNFEKVLTLLEKKINERVEKSTVQYVEDKESTDNLIFINKVISIRNELKETLMKINVIETIDKCIDIYPINIDKDQNRNITKAKYYFIDEKAQNSTNESKPTEEKMSFTDRVESIREKVNAIDKKRKKKLG